MHLANLELATQLYYIAQEAVTNAVKHAAATTLKVSLVRTDGHMALTVRDDGSGFDVPSRMSVDGMGLRLMNYHARLVDAVLDISSEPREGTTVTCLFVPN